MQETENRRVNDDLRNRTARLLVVRVRARVFMPTEIRSTCTVNERAMIQQIRQWNRALVIYHVNFKIKITISYWKKKLASTKIYSVFELLPGRQ